MPAEPDSGAVREAVVEPEVVGRFIVTSSVK
jgi:hypothetical protein